MGSLFVGEEIVDESSHRRDKELGVNPSSLRFMKEDFSISFSAKSREKLLETFSRG